MQRNILYFINRLKERLWIRPVVFCILSIGIVFLAQLADSFDLSVYVPTLERSSIKELLTTISASMLVISIFAVGAMISAYSAASSTATPRSFSLIIADDVSQNALSVYIGSFIYSVVATIALQNGYFGVAGQFALLVTTLCIFALVIMTFLRWVERIARLGRLSTTIEKIEEAAATAIKNYKASPHFDGRPVAYAKGVGVPVDSESIGYVQHVDSEALQEVAKELDATITVKTLPGAFAAPGRPVVSVAPQNTVITADQKKKISDAFTIGKNRIFDEDPRFGLIAMTEVASRALSPGINDPGTAIAIIGSHVRLFALWSKPVAPAEAPDETLDRVFVPTISVQDLCEDAFRPIARDGAGNIEVMIRLQKAFHSIAAFGDAALREAAAHQATQAYKRAKAEMSFEDDLKVLKANFALPERVPGA
ncbi:DUF2254 domain-containing protein [Pontibacter sp. CAU 1760]